jgi:hypothetical protein
MDRKRRLVRWTLILLAILVAPFALYAFFACWIVAVLLIFAWFAMQRRWQKNAQLTNWIKRLPIVNEVLKGEEEYTLKINNRQPVSAVGR